MKRIPLTQGKYALVDDKDYISLVSYGSWHFDRYAKRVDRKKVTYMHREIVAPRAGYMVDHINGDKLDNRRCNLRECRAVSNVRHQNPRVGTSEYKGVSWDKRRNKWKAYIGYNYKMTDIGRFDTEVEAALAYNRAAKKLHRQYAVLNKVGENARMSNPRSERRTMRQI